MGVCPVERGEDASPGQGGTAGQPDADACAVLERRLDEARALSQACDGLHGLTPHLSARSGMSAGQASGAWGFIAASLVFWLFAPDAVSLVAGTLAMLLFGFVIALRLAAAMFAPSAPSGTAKPRVSDEDLPLLTYLVPLLREANVVASLARAIEALDYPSGRIEVKFLVESDDEDTLAALRWLRLPGWFEIIPVPPGLPRTKPKALNYGLHFSRGEIVAVLDAEDRPALSQPREAVAALRAGGPDLAVVQAPLLIHNQSENWLAEQFAMEYAIHFRIWLPFLVRIGWPLPLGGTSNYFLRRKLVEAGGWDAWNVTEDADIGIRLARLGGRAGVIVSPTFEEAPIRFGHWLAQRTRWMKGHLQTWLVVTRHPASAIRELGAWGFMGFAVTLGGSLAASLLHGPVMIWIGLGLISPAIDLQGWHAAFLGAGYGSAVLAALAARVSGPGFWSFARMLFYWPLLSIAMAAAVWELVKRPHYWAKTPHGVTRR